MADVSWQIQAVLAGCFVFLAAMVVVLFAGSRAAGFVLCYMAGGGAVGCGLFLAWSTVHVDAPLVLRLIIGGCAVLTVVLGVGLMRLGSSSLRHG